MGLWLVPHSPSVGWAVSLATSATQPSRDSCSQCGFPHLSPYSVVPRVCCLQPPPFTLECNRPSPGQPLRYKKELYFHIPFRYWVSLCFHALLTPSRVKKYPKMPPASLSSCAYSFPTLSFQWDWRLSCECCISQKWCNAFWMTQAEALSEVAGHVSWNYC